MSYNWAKMPHWKLESTILHRSEMSLNKESRLIEQMYIMNLAILTTCSIPPDLSESHHSPCLLEITNRTLKYVAEWLVYPPSHL